MSDTTALHKGLRVLKLLPGHAMHGLSNRQLSEATGLSPSAVTRIMTALMEEGLAQRLDSGRFAPSMKLAQFGLRTLDELDDASNRIHEIRGRLGTAIRH